MENVKTVKRHSQLEGNISPGEVDCRRSSRGKDSQARVIRHDNDASQKAIVGILNDTRRDNINEYPLGGVGRSH